VAVDGDSLSNVVAAIMLMVAAGLVLVLEAPMLELFMLDRVAMLIWTAAHHHLACLRRVHRQEHLFGRTERHHDRVIGVRSTCIAGAA
jgi:hypothetical protein